VRQANNDPSQATREQLVKALAALVLQALRCRHVEKNGALNRSGDEQNDTSVQAGRGSATKPREP
jgi:hypothetical protein